MKKQINLQTFLRITLFVALFIGATAVILSGNARAQEADPYAGPYPIEHPDYPGVMIIDRVTSPDGVTATTINIPVQQAAFIASAMPNNVMRFTNPFQTELRAGFEAGGLGAMRVLLQFNLASVPANANITNATFNIFQNFATPANDIPMGFRSQYMRSTWSENTVTWNNANFLGGTEISIGEVTSPLGWKSLNATQVVQAWHSGSQQNFGAIITADERPDQNRSRRFNSNNSGQNPPSLTITFSDQCDNIAPTASISGIRNNGQFSAWSPASFTVFWSGTDSAPAGCAPSGIARYRVQFNINGGAWVDWQDTNQTSATFNNAGDGSVVNFRVREVFDNAGNRQTFDNTQGTTTIDSVPPSSSMTQLPTYSSGTVTLNWSGSDNRSGVASYNVQFRVNNGPWQNLLTNTTNTSHTVTGVQAGFYELRVQAVDRAGNVQPWPNTQTSTTVVLNPVANILPFNPPIIKDNGQTTFTVRWANFSFGNPIAGVQVWSRFNNGSWQLWQTFSATETFAEFTIIGDGAYEFEAVALSSNPQNNEIRTGSREASVVVDFADTVQPAYLLPFVVNTQ
jgi:hypothetical protein